MNYRVTIKEICKAVVDIEADSFEEAKAKVEEEYRKNPQRLPSGAGRHLL